MDTKITPAITTALNAYTDEDTTQADYLAASQRLTDTILEAVAEIDVESEVSIGSPESYNGQCHAEIQVRIRVADTELRATGWVLCGWLPVGASADLDGSGLALWGSSQPGGWTSCHGDGQCRGVPHVTADCHSIGIWGGEGCEGEAVATIDILIAARIVPGRLVRPRHRGR